jgi:hypothetical protein
VKFKSGPCKGELRTQPRDETIVREEDKQNGLSYIAHLDGNASKTGTDVRVHETESVQLGYSSRIVVRLVAGVNGGCRRARRALSYLAKRFSFRMYALRDADTGADTNEYTLSNISDEALAFVLSNMSGLIVRVDETKIRLPGSGSVEHVARKPKRKRASYHPDYTDFRSGFVREAKQPKAKPSVPARVY